MLKGKINLFFIGIAVMAMMVLFTQHSPAESANMAKTTPATPEKPLMIEATIQKIDTANKVITITKTKDLREKIIYKDKTPYLIMSTSETKAGKLADLKANDKIIIFVGYHPTRSEYYLAGLIISVNKTTPTVAIKPKQKTVAPPAAKVAGVKISAKKPIVKVAAKTITPKPAAITPRTATVPTPKIEPTPTVNTTATTPLPPVPIIAPAPTATPTTTPTPILETPQTSFCSPLPAPTGAVVTVSNWKELRTAVKNANENNGNVTIFLNDGEYLAEHFLFIYASNVAVRGKSGDRNKVIIKSPKMKGGASHIFGVIGDNVTIADMGIGQVANHIIQVFGEKDADNLLVHNVRFFDAYEQLLKVSTDNKHKEIKPENGIIECSLFEYTAGTGPQWYIGGVDAHNAHNWIVRDNIFRNIISPTSNWAEHAIHFWNDSAGTLVERNIIINSDRGIGFGLGDAKHTGGIIRNNMIYHNSSKGDVGIGLENANGVKVYNNTIFFEHNYPHAIEYRFAGTSAEIYNNLTNKKIQKREGNPVGDLQNNFTNALAGWFINPAAGNLRLTEKRDEVVDQGKTIENVKTDIDGQTRPQDNAYDVGADEWK